MVYIDAADVFAAFVKAIPELLPLRRALPEDNPLHIKLSKVFTRLFMPL